MLKHTCYFNCIKIKNLLKNNVWIQLSPNCLPLTSTPWVFFLSSAEFFSKSIFISGIRSDCQTLNLIWVQSGCKVYQQTTVVGNELISVYSFIITNPVMMVYLLLRKGSGSVEECLTWDRGAAGSSLTDITELCPWARHINSSLILVQPRKILPYITQRLLIGLKNQINKIPFVVL